jgi:tetratricopeptide (TPR) repeat protein
MYLKTKKSSSVNNMNTLLVVVGGVLLSFVFKSSNVYGLTVEESRVGDMSRTLKSALEENQGLQQQTQALQDELERLRAENESIQGRLSTLQSERDHLAEDVKKTKAVNRSYAKEVKKLEESLSQQAVASIEENSQVNSEGSLDENAEEVFSEGDNREYVDLATTTEDIVSREERTLDLLSRIDAFSEGDESLRLDAAKAHYNMGNIYFNKGEYEIAAREYYQAVALMPDDPDAHYNLAFVSGEHLKDYATALKHYQMYLYLNPNPSDRDIVIEKMTAARLEVEGTVDSVLDNN